MEYAIGHFTGRCPLRRRSSPMYWTKVQYDITPGVVALLE